IIYFLKHFIAISRPSMPFCRLSEPVDGREVFPPQTCFTGLAFSYNLACAIFAGLTPVALRPGH
ncbi:hypothetical protein, partial [Pseudomonas asplenii]|uniref:hypothetical protein n=1 Tax=Pseudomonas asplenii TaxID=53407 RepID=UPI001ED96446